MGPTHCQPHTSLSNLLLQQLIQPLSRITQFILGKSGNLGYITSNNGRCLALVGEVPHYVADAVRIHGFDPGGCLIVIDAAVSTGIADAKLRYEGLP